MNWISNVVRPKIRNYFARRDTPENLWIKCPETGQLVFYKDVEANQFVIPGSNYHMRMAAPANTASKAAVNLLSRSRIRNRNRLAWSPRSMSRLRACWGDPGPGRVGGDAGDAHAAGPVLDHHQDIEATQKDGVVRIPA